MTEPAEIGEAMFAYGYRNGKYGLEEADGLNETYRKEYEAGVRAGEAASQSRDVNT